MRERLNEGDHPDLALPYYNIGYTYYLLNDRKKELEYFFKALEIRHRLYEGDHPDLASLFNKMSKCLNA